ncbi:unnamed protein product [Closterium sp. Naga37s-1]|nr:unnamed protein product [Closterium sp. Naga37s-1]
MSSSVNPLFFEAPRNLPSGCVSSTIERLAAPLSGNAACLINLSSRANYAALSVTGPLHARVLHASASAAAVGASPSSDPATGNADVKGLQPSPPRASSDHAGEGGRSKLVEAFQIQAASDPIRGFMVALRKSELGFETGLALRDLRVVISALQNQIPTILIRPRAIVVSLAHVRAVITANRAYILNTSSPRVRQRLIPTLLRRLSASHAAAAAGGGNGGGGGGGGGGDGGCDVCSPPSPSASASFSGSDSFFSGAVSVFSDCGGEPQGREVRGLEGGGERGGREQKPLGRGQQEKQEKQQGQQQELGQGQDQGQGQGQGQAQEQWVSEAWGGGESRCRESGREVRGVCGRGEDEYEARGHVERREEVFLEEGREGRRGDGCDEMRDDRRDDGGDGGRDGGREEEWGQGWQEEVSERRREEWRARRQREEERRRNKRWLEDLEKESKGRFGEASNGEEEEGEGGGRKHGDGHLIGSDGQWERYGEVLLLELTSKDGVPLKPGQHGQSDQPGPSESEKPDQSGQKTHRGVMVRSGDEGKGVRREQAKGKGGDEGDWLESEEAFGSGGEASGRGAGESRMDGSGKDTGTKALLDEVGVTLKVKYASIFPGVYQGLRAFAGGRVPYERAMAEQEAFLRAKNELLRLERSANQICNAVREVLSNDEDMAEMYLSRKASLPPGEARGGGGGFGGESPDRKASLPPGTTNSAEHSEVEELLEDHLRRMEEVVVEGGAAVDMKSALPPGTTNSAEHSEVEELLEDHLRRMEEVVGEAEQLLSMSDATSEYLRTALDRWVCGDGGLRVVLRRDRGRGGAAAVHVRCHFGLMSFAMLNVFMYACAWVEGSFIHKLKSTCFMKLSSAAGKCSHGKSSVSRQRRRVGGKGVVAASPPTEEVEVQTEPLTKEDLVNYLRSGCKPKDKWRIGTEHEKFGFDQKTLQPMTYEQIATLLEHIADRFSWDKIMEGDRIIGLRSNGQSVTLEPGGQFELSGAPLETVHQTCAEVNGHLYQVKSICEEEHVGFLGLGFNPKHTLEEIPIMPKGRYTIMRNYMPKVGSLGLEMMFRTCTVQVNLDFDSEQDMVDKFQVGLALQPVATALFANSPFLEGKPNGYLSYRSRVWEDTDNDRTGDLPFVFEEGFGFERYVEYALDVPMYFAYRDQRYIDATGLSFRDFLNGKLPVLPGAYPTLNDWENHLTTIFPEVRLKRYLEMRGADGGSWRRICALPAFWVGLLYDRQALDECKAIISDWTELERSALRTHVPRMALKTPFREGLLQHLAQDLVRISREGLQRRGYREGNFLKELENIAATGVTPAERMLEAYHGSESAMSWIRSNLAKVGTFAGSVVQKAGDAVERGAKMVYEQAESAVVGRPHNSFRHAVRRIEEVASLARGSERKEALARWLAALSDIQQENDRLQAHFQRRKKRQEKGEKGGKGERKTQEENQQEEVTAESAASADGSAATGAAGAAAEAGASDAGASVSSGRTEGVGAEGEVVDRAGDEGKDRASVTEGNQAKAHGEAEIVEAGLSQMQADGAEGKTESVAAESGRESKDGVVGVGAEAEAEAGSKSAEAGDIAAAEEEAEEVASIGDGSSQDEAAPSLTKSALTGRASMVLFYDPDAGNEALNFRDVFLRSSALELIVASMVVAPGDEDEMALLRGLFGLCLNLSTTQCDDLLAALQSLGSSLSAYSELKLSSDDLATMVAEAVTGLKVNPEIERVDLESCRLQQLIAEAASVAASLGDTPGDRALKVERVSCLAAELSEGMEGLRRKAEECRQQRQEALAYRSSKAQEAREAEKVLLSEAQQVQKRKEELEEELRRVQAALDGVNRRLVKLEEEKDLFSQASTGIEAHLSSESELEAFGQSAKSIVERLDGIRAKREQAEKEGKDRAVSDSKHRRLQWEERYMAAEIQVKRCIGEAEIAMREIKGWLDTLPPSEDAPKQAQMRSLLAELESLVASVRASGRPVLSLDHPTVLRVQRLGKSPDSWASAEAAAAGRALVIGGSAAAGTGGVVPTGTEENVPPTPFVISGGVRRPVAPGFKDKQGKSKLLPAGESAPVERKQGKESDEVKESAGEEKGEEGGSDAAAEAGSAGEP